jgi:class 3 adenylate cyclase
MTSAGGAQEPTVAPLPSGTVTFLFTDIEGSTQRWEVHRSAMVQALARHDELLRAAAAAYRGSVFKTVGDAFCVAFARPQDAARRGRASRRRAILGSASLSIWR